MEYLDLLTGRNALITGGGRGIGKAIAIEYAKNGANVAVSARTVEELNDVVKKIDSFGVDGLAIPADHSKTEYIKKCVEEYFDYFDYCDILVCNAGMTQYSSIVDFPTKKAIKLFKLNLIAPYLTIKEILPNMSTNSKGNIILTSSVQGNIYFGAKKVAYASSKAGITALGKSLHSELKSTNINVNVIVPSAVQTKMIEDLKKLGQQSGKAASPESVALIYLFLASDLAGRKYKGAIINQYQLFEILHHIRNEFHLEKYNIDPIMKRLKMSLNEEKYRLLRSNKELAEFLLNYNSHYF